MNTEVFGEIGVAQTWEEYDLLKRRDRIRTISFLRHEFNEIRKRRFLHTEEAYDIYDFDVMGNLLARLEGGVYHPIPIPAPVTKAAAATAATTNSQSDDTAAFLTRLSEQVAALENEIRILKSK